MGDGREVVVLSVLFGPDAFQRPLGAQYLRAFAREPGVDLVERRGRLRDRRRPQLGEKPPGPR
ncbi:hypothetical protein ACFYZ8_41415 [Streptomyces sp. NPDC001668]|uniref:hypothetical protein n=1 Tax=unclassified Streptomyces TaxID=2593676 RepID=UPI003699FE86